MSAIDHIHTILSAAAVCERIFPVVAPQNVELPCLVLTLVDEDDDATLAGQSGYPVASVLVDCLSPSFGAANELGGAVKGALIDYRGDILDDGSPAVAVARVSYLLLSGIDHFDRGAHGDVWRRRLGFEMRYRDLVPT